MTNAIAVESLSKSFPGEDVLHDISLDIQKGEFCVVIGPSGCGKSTLLKCIAGLFDYQGEVQLDGTDASAVPIEDREIGFVFQEFEETLFPHMTVSENVAFGLEQQGVPGDEIDQRVEEMLELLAIPHTSEDYPDQLSGGQQQRVELARHMVRRCDIMLLDDPLADLDYKLQKRMELEMRRLHDSLGSAFVYVTHNQDQALKLADRIVVLNDGRVEQVGSPSEVYHKPETAFVGRFIGDSTLLVAESATVEDGTVTTETAVGSVGATPSSVDGAVTDTSDPEAVVLVRPEDIDIGEPATECTNRVTGTLEDRTYTGEFTEFSVSVEGFRRTFQVIEPGNREVGTVGADIDIGWDAADALYLDTISVTDQTTMEDLQNL